MKTSILMTFSFLQALILQQEDYSIIERLLSLFMLLGQIVSGRNDHLVSA